MCRGRCESTPGSTLRQMGVGLRPQTFGLSEESQGEGRLRPRELLVAASWSPGGETEAQREEVLYPQPWGRGAELSQGPPCDSEGLPGSCVDSCSSQRVSQPWAGAAPSGEVDAGAMKTVTGPSVHVGARHLSRPCLGASSSPGPAMAVAGPAPGRFGSEKGSASFACGSAPRGPCLVVCWPRGQGCYSRMVPGPLPHPLPPGCLALSLLGSGFQGLPVLAVATPRACASARAAYLCGRGLPGVPVTHCTVLQQGARPTPDPGWPHPLFPGLDSHAPAAPAAPAVLTGDLSPDVPHLLPLWDCFSREREVP